MSLAQGNNTPTRPRIEPGSPDPESNALTTRPVRSPNVNEKHVWIDYQCVLSWLHSHRPLGTFVENRIKELMEDREINFHYISTTENPADIASRGASVRELQHNRLWWHGPDWMVKTRAAWPVSKCEDSDKQSVEGRSQIESEFRKGKILFKAKLMAREDHSENMTNQLLNSPFNFNLQNFSSVTRLLWVTALALRFVYKLRKKKNQHGPLAAHEMKIAEILWIKYV